VKENREPTRKQGGNESLGGRDMIKVGASRDRRSLKRIQDPGTQEERHDPNRGILIHRKRTT
jgi:hypothetical protein